MEGEDDHAAGVAFFIDRGGEGPLVIDIDGDGGEVASGEAVVITK